jgi:hypothetical protein
MSFPVDNNSLYAQKIYDTQTAANRCYANMPRTTNIIEGFGNTFTMENIIKIGIVLLLIYLFFSLLCDYNNPQATFGPQLGGNITESYFELTPMSFLGEY